MPQSNSHISTSGGLLTDAFTTSIRELDTNLPATNAPSFALPWDAGPSRSSDLEDTIATTYELLLERWDAIQPELDKMDVSEVRRRWLLPLMSLLGFEPVFQRGDTVLAGHGLRFPLSHRGWEAEHAPVLHLIEPGQDLDARMGSGRGPKGKSPHDMLQAYLNSTSDERWAVVSNGRLLRLLRDYHHTFAKGYVQFDLEAIFETRNYADFRALYRLAHASRFRPLPDDDRIPLELFYKTALSTGVKVGEDLRAQVREAIERLGNGLLDPTLLDELADDPDASLAYYREVLRVVYRMLFLLFAEQRGMIPTSGAPLEDLYRKEYSLTALRERAEEDIATDDDHTDLWKGLQVTFAMVREGAEELGVFGYNGELFAANESGYLNGRSCRNSELLQAVRALTLIEREGVLQRISYLDLGVEELGSIYESLLDFTPRVSSEPETFDDGEIPANTFFLDPRGLERKQSGSYYTHPSLVNELIKSALLPVMHDRLKVAGLPVVAVEESETAGTDLGSISATLLQEYTGLTDAQRAAGAEALLGLSICDPAVGSGHFLVKANNVVAAELARIRSGEAYPTENALQAAKRDVLAHCIYAVDLNPMAVELCKVSLWINASVKDQPLNFLDHHIKCGNSLIGATPELLQDGVPYEAFDHTRSGTHKERAKEFRKRNRQERKQSKDGLGVQLGAFAEGVATDPAAAYAAGDFVQLSQSNPKQAREVYQEWSTDPTRQRAKLEADAWTAAFFWPIDEHTDWAPTYGEVFRLQREGPGAIPAEEIERIKSLADEHRFFHWHLEFPSVFGRPSEHSEQSEGSPSPQHGNGQTGENASANKEGGPSRGSGQGFDVVLGNPPWERIKLQEKEFFAVKAPEIAGASTAAKRKKKIKQLKESGDRLYDEYQRAQHFSEALSTYLRESGRYDLTAV
ncbi:MAG: restriction endonuclease, partial [Bacteroidetes bacterium]|nr:restriction endonuclease [Bacteroidota bacterium]